MVNQVFVRLLYPITITVITGTISGGPTEVDVMVQMRFGPNWAVNMLNFEMPIKINLTYLGIKSLFAKVLWIEDSDPFEFMAFIVIPSPDCPCTNNHCILRINLHRYMAEPLLSFLGYGVNNKIMVEVCFRKGYENVYKEEGIDINVKSLLIKYDSLPFKIKIDPDCSLQEVFDYVILSTMRIRKDHYLNSLVFVLFTYYYRNIISIILILK